MSRPPKSPHIPMRDGVSASSLALPCLRRIPWATVLQALTELPSKDQLRGQVVGTLQSPMSGLVNVLAGTMRGLLNVLNARSAQLETPSA